MAKMTIVKLLLLGALLGDLSRADFRASVVKVDITPSTPKWLLGYAPRKSTGVHDRIFHRIVAMDDGSTRLLIASTDVCLFSPTVYTAAAQRIQQETGIDPVHFLWTVTHTHSAPEVGPPGIYEVLLKDRSDHPVDTEYTEQVVQTLVNGAREALSSMRPAKIAVGTGMSVANINRRARDMDGKISLGLNPEGPVDRQIGLIRLDAADGKPIALLANYSMHGTVLNGRYTEISGDAQGTVAAYVEEKAGMPMLYINGAAGNLAPIYSVYADPKAGHLTQFNVLLGDRILEANRRLVAQAGGVRLNASEKWLETPRKTGLGWTEDLRDYSREAPGGEALVRLPIRFLTIGDTAIWTAPVELFCEIAIEIRNRSPFLHTFYFGYTNGWIGYLPTQAAYAEGGYEPATSVFGAGAERDLTEMVISHLQSLQRPAARP